ncbi:hypothetical protein BDW_04250 [Bdellovibrio bacteriovorus W]|nr:hypothetical protein BDW_04250 [Bdellovibrio bacteriovorus W]
MGEGHLGVGLWQAGCVPPQADARRAQEERADGGRAFPRNPPPTEGCVRRPAPDLRQALFLRVKKARVFRYLKCLKKYFQLALNSHDETPIGTK